MSKKIKLAWLEYRKEVCVNQEKSQDDFEKYINLIASGALGLTVTFIDKIVPIDQATYIWIIATGWVLLAVTLLVNLYSHHKSAKFSAQTISQIDSEEYEMVQETTINCNKEINGYNKLSLYSLFCGIILIIIFVTINIYNMSDKEREKQRHQNQPRPLTEEKGRTIPQPPREKPANNNPKK